MLGYDRDHPQRSDRSRVLHDDGTLVRYPHDDHASARATIIRMLCDERPTHAPRPWQEEILINVLHTLDAVPESSSA